MISYSSILFPPRFLFEFRQHSPALIISEENNENRFIQAVLKDDLPSQSFTL